MLLFPFIFVTIYFELYGDITNDSDAKTVYSFLEINKKESSNIFIKNIISQNFETYIDKYFIEAEFEEMEKISMNGTNEESDLAIQCKIVLEKMINNLYEKFDGPNREPKDFIGNYDPDDYVFDKPNIISVLYFVEYIERIEKNTFTTAVFNFLY